MTAEESNDTAFRIFEKEFKIPRTISSTESVSLEDIDVKTWLQYLEQVCELFRGEIPHVKHPKLDYAEFKQKNQTSNTMADFARLHRIAAAKREALAKEENGANQSRKSHHKAVPPAIPNVEHRRGRKRRSYEKHGNIVSKNLF
jgi:hypothetical protein